jgi:SRSO17 transposase
VTEIRRRRARSKIPDQVRHREKWRQALDMLDEIIGDEQAGGWGLAGRPVVADAGYGDTTGFRLGLEARGLPYVLAVNGATSAYPADAMPVTPPDSGQPPVPRYRDNPSNLTAVALAAGRPHLRRVTWRHGSRKNARNPTAAMASRFLALRVRPANRDIPRNPDDTLPECWLIAEWPPEKPEPTDYWLSTLPIHTPLRELVRLAKIRWRIEHDYRELKDELGLDHFEGRSYIGWHRHVTLATIAQAFCTLLRHDPKAPAPA